MIRPVASRAPPSAATRTKSAKTIKRFWQAHKHLDTLSLVRAFRERGPTKDRVRNMRYLTLLFWLRARSEEAD